MKKILALIAAISLVTLTACGNSNAAATLGKTTISQSQLQTTVDTILKEREAIDVSQMQLESGAELNRSQLRFLVISNIFDQIAAELKLGVTKTEIATTRQTLISESGGEEALASNLVAAQIASTNFDTYIRAIIISDKITAALQASGVAEEDVATKLSELVQAKTEQLKISINPRYGTWDDAAGDIVAVDAAGDAVQAPAAQ